MTKNTYIMSTTIPNREVLRRTLYKQKCDQVDVYNLSQPRRYSRDQVKVTESHTRGHTNRGGLPKSHSDNSQKG